MKAWTHVAGMIDVVLPKLRNDRVALLRAKNRMTKALQELDEFVISYASEINRIRHVEGKATDCTE